jgi:2-polyprenyl-6-methoxyphenol hydroxylase-like FAD-dependent oxidoreductase
MRVAVIGAGVSGLAAALTLSHDGHEVVVLERDATPLPNSADEAFDWKRRGAPQVRHSHAFLARGRNVLRDRLPHVRDALLEAGATEVGWIDLIPDTVTDRSPQPEDEDIVMLACRRTTFEWVLRRQALHTDRVEIRDGIVVTGLNAVNGSRVPRITGVQTDSGDVDADIILDATGRPSHLINMLSAVGGDLTETKSSSGIVYLSRFYRLRDGVDEPSPMPFNGADVEYLKYAVFRGDNRTFSVTLAYDLDDSDMTQLRERGLFDAAVPQMHLIAPWVDPDVSEPISDVHYMGGLINRLRHFVVDGTPVALGLHAVGDSSVCTNPLYGRGCSLGLVHGALFADALTEHGDDLEQLALAFDAATQEHLVPWYDASVSSDKVNMQIARGEKLSDFDAYVRSLVNDGIFPAARFDATVSRSWTRAFNLLTVPYAVMIDPDVMRISLEYYEARESREPWPLQGPPRDEFLKAIHS